MTTFYLDYENGDDAADGSTFVLTGLPTVGPWKTFTLGATAARIAPNDTIRIAKSPAPVSIGNGTWTNLSKTVTLATAQTLTVDLCETAWTADHGSVTRQAVATDAKEGSYCMQITADASPVSNERQAYYNCADIDLSTKQKLSFWLKNEVAIATANEWVVELCDDDACTNPVDVFKIPAIPSVGRWIPLTIARNGGGNLSASVKGIRISTGATSTPTASKYIRVDDFVACTTSGLNLQSLISKNSAEQGGTEGWYAIQSISGVTVLLDTDTNTLANAGEGYSTSGTTPETVTTYQRETIKTALATIASTVVNNVMDSGSLAVGNIQFQGGYDTTSGNQTGETFFDGLNGFGYGIQLSGKTYVTLNYLNVCRYERGIYFSSSNNNTITTVSNANNNSNYGIVFNGNNNTITTVSNANNNSYYGIYFNSSNNNTITTVSNANNNSNYGIVFSGNNNTITTVSNANNNSNYGIYFNSSNNNTITTVSNANNNSNFGIVFNSSNNNTITTVSNANNNSYYGIYFNGSNNTITTLNTTGNANGSIELSGGWNYIGTATIAESTKVSGIYYMDSKVFISNLAGYAYIGCDYATIVSQAATAGGTGIEWKMSPTNVARASYYPLKLKLATFAATSGNEVTITSYFKKSHATDIVGKLIIPGNQLGGDVANVVTTCPSDTSRNLLTVKFTPSANGVFTVEAWAYWAANTADKSVIVDDISISQV